MDPADCNLAGTGVLITRAAHQAEGLCKLVDELNGRPLRFPALEISAPAQTEQLKELLARIEDFDVAVFISANAVKWGVKYLSKGRLPEQMRTASVGLATAQALAESGHQVTLVPKQGFDSEALLAAPELSAQQVAGKRVLIFRGKDGRALLGETLTRRGALVEYAEVYQRSCPEPTGDLDKKPWLDSLDVITATSNAILDNLYLLFGETQRARLQQTPLVVISERMREHAHALGCRQVILADGPDDRAIVEAICRWIVSR
ncbi:MAG: uroporphyrinogen-III synthase [Chromatiaceae bacterium]|nr:uroporphyrinogen-III synthase [Chromatiaceae bacterium]MCP5445289.1 uroporphyrinogen-III synthase [Chromatiaceae bacterium]